MLRFTKEMGDALKSKMLQRLDNMALAEQDIKEIINEHGLNEAQISHWMRNFRFRYSSKSREEIVAYLRGEEKVRDLLSIFRFENPSKSEHVSVLISRLIQ